jgi:hypothetical protein
MHTNATPGMVEAQVQELPRPLSPLDNNKEGEREETQPLSPQFAALAKQRRALQQERQAFEREKAERAAATPGATVDLARLKSEPLRVLLESGVTYDQLTQSILANDSGYNPEIQALKAELKALKDGVDNTLSERDKQARAQVLSEMRREATRLVQDDSYELVRETRSIPKVMELIERTFDDSGEVLDVTEAMQLVEAELEKDSLRLAQLKKIQSRLSPPVAQPQPQQRPVRTLTNRDTASVPVSAKARAMAAFYGRPITR